MLAVRLLMDQTDNTVQTPGTYISAIGHAGLIGWLLLGWGFSADPFDIDVTEVSVVTGEEYAALVAATTPQPNVDAPVTPVAPQVEPAPVVPEQEATSTPVEPPIAAEPPQQEAPPPQPPAPPAPPADVAEEAPNLVVPEQTAAPSLDTSTRPRPRPAPRIAPQPVAPPEPETTIDDIVQEAVIPDAQEPAEVVEEPVEATAPEEAATEVVTDVEEPSGAVTSSIRPQVRPNRPAPQTTAASSDNVEPESSDTNSDDSAVADALAEALAAVSSAPQGPPLSGSETEGFRLAVNRCWNVDLGSEAARVTVTVSFELGRDGKVQGNVRQVAASGGSPAATEAAFQSARRAILRCGASGYDLPVDKYDHWKEVEITFDPSGMRFR